MNRKTYISQNELTPEMTGNAYRENVRRRKKQEDLRRAALFGSTTPDNLKIEGGGLMPQEFLAPSSQRQREYVILTTPVDFPEIGERWIRTGNGRGYRMSAGSGLMSCSHSHRRRPPANSLSSGLPDTMNYETASGRQKPPLTIGTSASKIIALIFCTPSFYKSNTGGITMQSKITFGPIYHDIHKRDYREIFAGDDKKEIGVVFGRGNKYYVHFHRTEYPSRDYRPECEMTVYKTLGEALTVARRYLELRDEFIVRRSGRPIPYENSAVQKS